MTKTDGKISKMNNRLIMVISALLLCLAAGSFSPQSVSAMEFSDPVLIGITTVDRKKLTQENKFYWIAEKALSSSVKYQYYDFGTNKNHVRLDISAVAAPAYNNAKFGDPADIDNNNVIVDPDQKIYEISAANGQKVYVLLSNAFQGDMGGGVNVIGKYQNRYVTYINNQKMYASGYRGKVAEIAGEDHAGRGPFGNQNNLKVTVDGDTIIINCEDGYYDSDSKTFIDGIRWQYLLKWDENAQWFGIEYKNNGNWKDELIPKALNMKYDDIQFTNGTYHKESPVYDSRGIAFSPVVGEMLVQGKPRTVVVWISWKTGGGTGIFCNAMIAVEQADGTLKALDSQYLGDRIKVENINIHKDKIIITYLDHAPNEGLSEAPTSEKNMTITIN